MELHLSTLIFRTCQKIRMYASELMATYTYTIYFKRVITLLWSWKPIWPASMLLVFLRFRHLVYTTCTSFILHPSMELAYIEREWEK